MNVDFEDNGNDEYGLVFSRDSEYDPLPSFQFNDRLNLKRQVLESVIRADEENGRDASEKKLELEFLEDVFESLDDII